MTNLTQLSEIITSVNINLDSNLTTDETLTEDFDLKLFTSVLYQIKVNLTELNRTITNYSEQISSINETTQDDNSSIGVDNSTNLNTTD